MIGNNNAILDINSKYKQLINYTIFYDATYNDLELNECKENSDGWGSTGAIDSDKTRVEPVKATSGISLTLPSSTYRYALMHTLKEYDFSNYKKTMLVYLILSDIMWGAFMLRPALSSVSGTVIRNLSNGSADTTANGYKGIYSEVKDISISTGYLTAYLAKGTSSDGTGSLKVKLWAMFKEDNWEKLCEIYGIDSNMFINENDLCNNISIITQMLNNKHCVDFMIKQCTGSFMAEFTNNKECLLALYNSKYRTYFQANEHWNKFLNLKV